MVSPMSIVFLSAALFLTALGADANCMSAATCSDFEPIGSADDDKTSMLQTRTDVEPQFFDDRKTAPRASKPKVLSPACGFETAAPFCQTWTNVKGDQFDWTRRSGSTPSSRTGPSRAHSGNHYLYIEASWRRGGDKAILQSSTTTFGTGAWLSFQYHMYGPRIGTLKVVFKETGSSAPVTVWQKSGGLGNKWHLAGIDLSPYAGKTGVIQLIGTITHRCANFLGDTAIDELSLTPGSAPTKAPDASPTKAPDASTLFKRIDSDKSGTVNKPELRKAVADGTLIVGSPALFDRVDADKSGVIQIDELQRAVGSGIIKIVG